MPRKDLVLITIVFALAGIGLYALVRQSSHQETESCQERCRAAGKVAVVAPTGTAGRSIDGGANWGDPPNFCNCVNPATISNIPVSPR